MEHVVFFPAPDGTPAFRRVPDFEDAVRFVEHLRNVENVTTASVHTLTEVPLAFRAWYRVEMPAPVAPPAPEPVAEAEVAEAEVAEPVLPEPVEADVAQVEPEPSFPFSDFDIAAASESGSATGIVVTDPGFASFSQPFEAGPPAVAEVSVPIESAPVLEPAAAARRDRGLGFFAR